MIYEASKKMTVRRIKMTNISTVEPLNKLA